MNEDTQDAIGGDENPIPTESIAIILPATGSPVVVGQPISTNSV